MALALQTAPAVEPLAVVDAKRYWGVDFGEDDDRIALCVTAGRQWCESFLGRAIVNRTNDLYLRRFPSSRVIRLPYPPLSSVTSIDYTGTDGASFGTTLGSGDYTVETFSEPGRVILDDDAAWPTLYGDGEKSEVRVRYVAGMGASASALLTAQRHGFVEAVSVVGRAFYENPELFTSAQRYRNETAEALLWHDRFLGEVDGL